MPGKESITPADGKDPERDYPFLKMKHTFSLDSLVYLFSIIHKYIVSEIVLCICTYIYIFCTHLTEELSAAGGHD